MRLNKSPINFLLAGYLAGAGEWGLAGGEGLGVDPCV